MFFLLSKTLGFFALPSNFVMLIVAMTSSSDPVDIAMLRYPLRGHEADVFEVDLARGIENEIGRAHV